MNYDKNKYILDYHLEGNSPYPIASKCSKEPPPPPSQ